MKFLCLCLAPAIDATVRMNAWPTDGCIIKNAVDTFAPGGKTVNVARWLAIRCACAERAALASAKVEPRAELRTSGVVCGGLLGEDNARVFEKELAQYGIEDQFVRIPGATRVNEMFVTPTGCFKINRPAGGPFEGFERFTHFEGVDVVVLSGSLPQTWPCDTYRVFVAAAQKAGAKVVLDASGPALVEGVKAHPNVIKPNAEECAPLIGFVPQTPEDFRKATTALKACCDYPIISDGASGCWFDGTFVPAPQVAVLDTTAAGDTLLAEWCWRTFGASESSTRAVTTHMDSARWAVAAGSAACTMPGGEPPDVALVAQLMAEIGG